MGRKACGEKVRTYARGKMGLLEQKSIGLLLLRLFLGGVMVYYGILGLAGGPERWEGVGSAMALFGIEFLHVVFGFLAKAVEAIGGLLVFAGVFFRPALISLVLVMAVAVFFLISNDRDPRFPMSLVVISISLMLTGPGKIAARLF